MSWLHTLVVVIHVLLAAAIVGLVLLQRGKGADAGAGFGAGASGTVFGARGSASFLSRLTATFAALFIGTSLILTYMGSRPNEQPKSVIERVGTTEQTTTPPAQAPATDAPPALPAAPASQDVETPSTPAPAQQ